MVMVYHPYELRPHEERRSGRKAVLALVFALGLPMVAGFGYTIDTLRGYAVQARLSQAVDAAALAGGRVMFDDQRDGHIRTFFATAFPNGFLGSNTAPLAIDDDPRAGTLTVSGQATVKALFTRLMGGTDLTVEAHSIVRRGSAHGRKGS
ncbi:TadE/TadG family type IV pilus assembly protein [Azospirillum sp. sgz302134]